MILLIVFAFLAGVITILSPCILPVLPIVLSSTIGSREIGKARPMGVVTGFVLSFTFFTLFLSTIVRFSGISADALRLVSVFVIAGFGLSLLIPQLQLFMERLFSRLAGFMPSSTTKTGPLAGKQDFWSGILVGVSLGLLWSPCVGPILASVISLAITGTVSLSAVAITLAYSFGTAVPMFLVIYGGQNLLKKAPWLLANTPRIQKVFGFIMVITAVGILYNVDRKFQTYIINTFPQYGAGLTKFEDIEPIRKQITKLGGKAVNKADMGKPAYEMLNPKGEKAPEIIPGGIWLNSRPLTLAQLKGKVVVVDFWTYSCINCQRTMPYLRAWHKKYHDKGLVIIGVHSPEFEFEKDESNLARAIADFDLQYPIVQDNNFDTWRAYNNRYWPAKYFIDKEGFIRYTHFGEGAYDESERVIQELLAETGVADVFSEIDNPFYQNFSKTPETYLGFGRLAGFASPEDIKRDASAVYTVPAGLGENQIAFQGSWFVMEEYANPQKDAKLFLDFESKEVFLVMRSKGSPAKVKIFLDDVVQNFGEDNHGGVVTVDSDRLYKLIKLQVAGRHILRLEFIDGNTELYAFTFG